MEFSIRVYDNFWALDLQDGRYHDKQIVDMEFPFFKWRVMRTKNKMIKRHKLYLEVLQIKVKTK
jgi:hypothetical protein